MTLRLPLRGLVRSSVRLSILATAVALVAACGSPASHPSPPLPAGCAHFETELARALRCRAIDDKTRASLLDTDRRLHEEAATKTGADETALTESACELWARTLEVDPDRATCP